jgi:hypothetical protein
MLLRLLLDIRNIFLLKNNQHIVQDFIQMDMEHFQSILSIFLNCLKDLSISILLLIKFLIVVYPFINLVRLINILTEN